MKTLWLIPRLNVMFRGMMDFTEKDKEILYEHYKFLKYQSEKEDDGSADAK